MDVVLALALVHDQNSDIIGKGVFFFTRQEEVLCLVLE